MHTITTTGHSPCPSDIVTFTGLQNPRPTDYTIVSIDNATTCTVRRLNWIVKVLCWNPINNIAHLYGY